MVGKGWDLREFQIIKKNRKEGKKKVIRSSKDKVTF